MTFYNWRMKAGIVLTVAIVLSTVAVAQLPTGTILGVVKDTSGGVMPGTAITMQNTETGQARTVTTGDDGAYRVSALPVGHYTMKIEKSGFRTQTQQGVVLDVAQDLVVNPTLEVGTSAQEVVVTGEAPLVNTTTSTLGGLVNEEKMSDLPLNGRNYIDLSLMQAGVTQAKSIGTGAGMSGTWFSSNGAPVRSNNVTIDGAMMVNQLGGSTSSGAGTTLGVDGIREYRVITNTFSAEYGMAMGSQMVIVSKGGSNRFTGDVFEYLRNSSLDARNFFDTSAGSGGKRLPEFQRNNFGGAFGGPIKKDKTFFFGVYEGLRQNLGFTATDNVPALSCHNPSNVVDKTCDSALATGATEPVAPVIQPLLALYPSPNLPNNQYTFPTAGRQSINFGQIRLDQNFSDSDLFFARYTIDNGNLNNPGGTGTASTGNAYPQYRTSGTSRNQFLTLAENHIFSPTLLSTTRLSFSRTRFTVDSLILTNLTGPQYSFLPEYPVGSIAVTGLTTFNPTASYPTVLHLQNIYTFSHDIDYIRGKHALKFGILFNRFNQGENSVLNTAGLITFGSLQGFLKGVPQSFTALTPGSDLNRDFLYNTLAFYVQDNWRTTSRLTLNLGLRYEFMTTIGELLGRQSAFRDITKDATVTMGPVMNNPSLKNFSPRIGFAYDLTGKGKTSIRGGFGMYYDLGNLGSALDQETLSIPPYSSRSIHNNQGVNAVVTLPLTFGPADLNKNLQTMDYNAKQPTAIQYNLTVEQQLPGSLGLSVSYVGMRGLHLWTEKEGNPTIPTSITNGIEYWATNSNPRVNPNWGTTTLDTTAGDSWYNSLQVVLSKRLSRGLELQSAYTWSKALDTTQSQLVGTDCTASGGTSGTDPQFPKTDRGPSCFDAKNNWRFNLMYHFPNIKSDRFGVKVLHGWWIANIVSVQSGYAFTPIVTANRSQSANLVNYVQDRVNIGTTTSTNVIKGNTYTFIPYDPNTVTTGNPQQWYNPLMFTLGPVGYLGTGSRNMLRGPGLGTWDFSLVKDTALPLLGERGGVQFRVEFFNILNRANFGLPNGTVFPGTVTDIGTYSEAPSATAGQITTTSTTSRQIQLALKVVF